MWVSRIRLLPKPGWSECPVSCVLCLSSESGMLLLCLWPYSSQGLSGCPCSLLPLRTVWMSGVWSDTWDHVGVWGPCCYQGHTDLDGLCCHQAQGDTWTPGATKGCVCVSDPAVAGVCVHVHSSCFHRDHRNQSCWNSRSVLSWPWESWLYSLLDYSHRRAASPCFPNQERWSHSSPWVCTSPGQPTRADPVVEEVSKLALRAWEQQSWLPPWLPMWWHG